MSATSAGALVFAGLCHSDLNEIFATPSRRGVLIGQIKKPEFHVASLLSPGCGSNKQCDHLFTMSKDPAARRPKADELPNLLSVCDVSV